MTLSPEALITWMNAWPPEAIWPLMLLLCYGSVVTLHRWFGAAGLYVYIAVAVIGANIQVLKVVKFTVYPDPVALGTILFASTYLATNILAEQFGKSAAQRGIWLGFVGFLLFTLLMIVNLGYAPLTPAQAGETMAWALPYHSYMVSLFTPQIIFFAAGMISYLVSQYYDVWLYQWLRARFDKLWLRSNGSTAVSAFIDSTVFSTLAWIVFAAEPLPFSTVFFTYILGTYWLRLAVSVLDTPFMYLARHWSYQGLEDRHV